jgi:predicted outer membrane repeat protein
VIDSTLSGNLASFRGGGLLNFRSATVAGSTFSGNSAGSDSGGGIYSEGSFSGSATLSVTASTFQGNSSAFFGGGVFSGSQNTATVATSKFSGNSSLLGGGIANFGTASLSVVNSTFSGNSAVFAGGGMYNASFDGSASLAVTSSTISGNSSANGGGIFNFDAATIRNTIVALNTGDFGPDVSGIFTSSGFNLIGIGDGSTGFTATGDQVGTAASPIDPVLGPLADNGGPTETMALLPGSPALNAGDPALAGTTDRRGVLRPQGPGVDIGAFELEYHTVDVVVKPGSNGAPINLNSHGQTPVAILGSVDFDVAAADLTTIQVEDPTLGIQVSPVESRLEDVNGDGQLDLLLFFSTEELADGALDAESIALLLTGFTTDGLGLFGTASVRIVGGNPRT